MADHPQALGTRDLALLAVVLILALTVGFLALYTLVVAFVTARRGSICGIARIVNVRGGR